MRELALFTGAGGGLLGSILSGWQTVCAVEIDTYCRSVLLARQRDGILPRFPIWDDVKTFDGQPWKGAVDVVSGGFPCQDISTAGRGAGLAGKRSGLWFEMLRIISEVRPAFVFVENSPHLRTRGLNVVLDGLTGLGYDCRWCVLGARHIGANHRRDRMWILAHAHHTGQRVVPVDAEMASAQADDGHAGGELVRFPGGRIGRESGAEALQPGIHPWWREHPDPRVDDGVAYRMDRIRATGNGQVPGVAALAWEILSR